MRVANKIDDKKREEIRDLIKEEKRVVVKERLMAVSMYANKMQKKDISKVMGRNRNYVGRWISAYMRGGIEALKEKRGGDHSSYLSREQKEELGYIITNTYPINFKGWDGKIIVDLIKDKWGVTYTRNGVYAILKSLNISHKIATKVDPKKSEEKISEWKEESKKNT